MTNLHLIYSELKPVFETLSFPFEIVDIEGTAIEGSTDKKYIVTDPQLQKDHTILPLEENKEIIGYCIIDAILTQRERVYCAAIIGAVIEKTTASPESHHIEDIWRELLMNIHVEENILRLQKKGNYTPETRFGVFLIKFSSNIKWNRDVLQRMKGIFEQYMGEYCLLTVFPMTSQAAALVYTLSTHPSAEENHLRLNESIRFSKANIIKQIRSIAECKEKHCIIAVSEHVFPIDQLSEVYTLLLDFGRTVIKLSERSGVVFVEHNPLYFLIQQISLPTASTFIHMVFKNFEIEDSKKSIESLQVLFKHNLNISKAAQELKIHRHTLEYRLNKLYEYPNDTKAHLRQTVQFYIALLLMELYGIHDENEEKKEKKESSA